MPSMTLFDVSDLFGSERPPDEPADAPAVAPERAVAPDCDRDREGAAPAEAAPEVEVRISARRKKTSEAKWVAGRIIVSLPAHLDVESRQKTIDWLVDRLLTRQRLAGPVGDDELLTRAIALSDRYRLRAHPLSVRWVTNQTARWASCSYYSGHIRVSHRLRAVPDWVLDSVLVHEVAHLTYPDHSPAFHRLAGAYPRHEEAGVFLAGYGLGLSHRVP
jgi:YgjP-like, metallopeptidase domain